MERITFWGWPLHGAIDTLPHQICRPLALTRERHGEVANNEAICAHQSLSDDCGTHGMSIKGGGRVELTHKYEAGSLCRERSPRRGLRCVPNDRLYVRLAGASDSRRRDRGPVALDPVPANGYGTSCQPVEGQGIPARARHHPGSL